jgi:hypothetical protein
VTASPQCSHPRDRRARAEVAGTTSGDTLDLLRTLEGDGRFRRDSWLGGIFHPGTISYREVSATESLHILVDGPHVSAHVDEVSPLATRADGTIRYAWGRVLAHNVTVVVADVVRRLRRRSGENRCNLHCDAVWVDEEADGHPGAAPASPTDAA